jgi:hypothetical protein
MLMKRIYFLAILILFFSCKNELTETTINNKDYIEKTLDFIITNKDNQQIELPNLYDSLSIGIPEKSEFILARKLTKRGFKEIRSGRGNYPPRSPRIVTKIFQKNNCVCELSKIYYYTTYENHYEMAERISCKDSIQKK